MPFYLADGHESPEIAAVLHELAANGKATDLQRALASSPDALRAYLVMSRHVRFESGLEDSLRELVILRIQQFLRGEYEWRRHVRSALSAGVTEAQIDGLENWRPSALYSRRERAALTLTEAHLGAGDVRAAMTEIAETYSRAETVELCLLIGFYLLGGALIIPFDLTSGDTMEPAPLPMFRPDKAPHTRDGSVEQAGGA